IGERDLDALFVTGPGHGGPGRVANTYLEGTYSEVYPNIGRDEDGLRRLFRHFSFPGGLPSHVAPQRPGPIHERAEIGYARAHAPRAPGPARGVDALVPARGAVRRVRRAGRRPRRTAAARRPAHGREPAHQRRRAAARPAPARLPRLRGRRALAGRDVGGGHA